MYSTGRLIQVYLSQVVRLCTPVPRPPTRPACSSMSLSCSSGQKVLESPFSHAQLYGVEHPTCGSSRVSSVPSTGTGKGKRKPKASKRRKPTRVTSSESMAKPKNKKKKRAPSSSIAPPVKNETHKASSPAVFSLAQVDTDSPRSHVNHHPTAFNALNSRKKDQNCPTIMPPSCTQPQTSNPVTPKETRATTTTISSLLSFSKMSTSDLVLSLSAPKGNRQKIGEGEGGGGGPVMNIRLKAKCGPNLNLPPHMRIHRQALETSLGRGVGDHKKGVWSLTVEEISRSLGRSQYRHIIVMSGAGISTPSGIPDFRYIMQ